MKSTVFYNKKGQPTSIRKKVGETYTTYSLKPGEMGKFKGVTFKGANFTTRFGSSGRLIGMGTKSGRSTYYTNSLGKKRNSLTPY